MSKPVDVLPDGSVRVSNGIIEHVHSARQCAGRSYGCWIHEPLPHALSQVPVRWRNDRGIAERICEHEIGHPDPQDVAYNLAAGCDIRARGCDGCCGPAPSWVSP